MKKAKGFLYFAIFSLQSCVITNTPGFHSGYNKLNQLQQQRIKFLPITASIENASGDSLHAVSAQNILRSVQNKRNALVYVWSPHCHSKVCASLKQVQTICDNKGYQLYVVSEYYDLPIMSVQPKLAHPLCVINHKFYKTDYCPKYTNFFTNELTQGQQVADSLKYARYFVFNNGKFAKAANSLSDKMLFD